MSAKAPAAQTDPEMTLLVALEDTADLPAFWLDRAATHLRREDPGEFFPSSELIRRTAATLFRAARERATGLIDYSPQVGRLPLRASREIDSMHEGPEAVGLLAWSQKLLKG
jgi:hypothetical protein